MSPHLAPVSSEPPSPFDAIKNTNPETGTEFWSARDLMPLMGYPRWNEFKVPLERAMKSAAVQGNDVESLFRGSAEKTSGRPREDFHLTRFAAYLVAMNGDPNKPEVAAAQAYFAIKTREAETSPRELSGAELMARAVLQAESTIKELEAKAAEDAPKVGYYDTFVAESDLIEIRTLANQLNRKETEIRDVLLRKEWIYRLTYERWSNKKQCKVKEYQYRAYAHKKPYFQLVPAHDAPRLNGEVRQTLKLTPAGATAVSAALAQWERGQIEFLFAMKSQP
ncbi:phage antirepressor KilAC domain-containing protein [Corynebacterium diphtheriae]